MMKHMDDFTGDDGNQLVESTLLYYEKGKSTFFS